MKKNTLIGIGSLVAMLAFGVRVSAATVSLSCEKQDLRKGESTTCSINATGVTEAITSFSAEFASQYLTVSDITPNSTIGMSDNGSTANTFNFKNTSMVTASGDVTIGSFTLTLDENAQNIGDGTCGVFCLTNVKINENQTPDNMYENKEGICLNPGFIEETCEGEECDPNTGAFTSYLLLGGGALVALVAIVLVRRNSKFYNV